MNRKTMHPTLLAMLLELEFSRTAVAMCCAGVAVLLIGIWAVKKEFLAAGGLDKVAALNNLCVAVPLAVFGAEHLSGAQFIQTMVPPYMPWKLFWAYFVGFALIAAALSIATKVAVRWSGLLFGIMMFLFVAMIHFPNALANPHDRIPTTIVFREMSFGGAGWILAGNAIEKWRGQVKGLLITAGRVLIALAAVFFGAQHFLHPMGLPGVPLEKQMPDWVPARALIDYVTGAGLLIAGASFLLHRKTRTVATWLGAWLLLLIVVVYGPVMILALLNPDTAIKVEGINYFADTLLFAGGILAVANAASRSN
jgi:uncharacterized membrane protein